MLDVGGWRKGQFEERSRFPWLIHSEGEERASIWNCYLQGMVAVGGRNRPKGPSVFVVSLGLLLLLLLPYKLQHLLLAFLLQFLCN